VNDLDLPLRRYTFEVADKTAHVFLALWEERSMRGTQQLPLTHGINSRLKAALQGKRHQGLKKLEISIIGPANSSDAVLVLQREVEKLIILNESP
jgi:hypothetical protein